MTKRVYVILWGIILLSAICFAQGPMVPPGPPGETYKSLGEIEPRTPIKSLPFTIDSPGSYYLTGNMSYPNPTQHAININTSNVTLDMMGFTITGPIPDSGNIFSAINVQSGTSCITIKNGMIVDWGGFGIDCDSTSNTKIVNMDVNRTGDCGIYTGYNSQIIDCNVSSSKTTGILTGYNSLVKNCNVRSCSVGIYSSYYTRVLDCGAYDNVTDGITLRNGCVAQNCTSGDNGQNGIRISGTGAISIIGCNVNNNSGNGIGASTITVTGNDKNEAGAPPVLARVTVNILDCTAEDNLGDGYELGAGSNIQRCLAKSNGRNGIEISESKLSPVGSIYDSYAQIKDCHCYGNTGDGIYVYQYVNIIGNNCVKNDNGIYIATASFVIIPSPGDKGAATYPGRGNRIEGNSVVENTTSGIDVPANAYSLIIKNWAYGNGVDYALGSGNLVGPIVTSDLATNDNAHANFSYVLP
jgi:hypothetical protein